MVISLLDQGKATNDPKHCFQVDGTWLLTGSAGPKGSILFLLRCGARSQGQAHIYSTVMFLFKTLSVVIFWIRHLFKYKKIRFLGWWLVVLEVEMEMMHISLFGLTDWVSSSIWKVTLFVHSSKGRRVGWLFLLEMHKGSDQEELSFICWQFHPQTFPTASAECMR
jgi:hypothetical protein